MHIHVASPDGEAKFWMEPTIEVAGNHGIRAHELSDIAKIIEERADEIAAAWRKHFST